MEVVGDKAGTARSKKFSSSDDVTKAGKKKKKRAACKKIQRFPPGVASQVIWPEKTLTLPSCSFGILLNSDLSRRRFEEINEVNTLRHLRYLLGGKERRGRADSYVLHSVAFAPQLLVRASM